ncbi:hypothetical protein ACN28E_21205 [Archangium lansingense]|uniref:CIS tube protein n=1 Tax=Archangium lansingense TaxID=2995310 RepID=UPI003B7C3A41
MENGPNNAEFQIKGKKPIKTHFNPATLQITLSTKVPQSKDKKKGSRQVVNESTAKLSVELIFDTTATGENVCDKTVQIARLVGDKDTPPPTVTFAWGAFKFEGIVDSYKETLDFFSDTGVPLRSTISLGMTKDEYALPEEKESAKIPEGVEITAGRSTTEAATQGGAPAAGRNIAAANGEESMRFPRSPTLVIDASVSLTPPTAFTSLATGGAALPAAFADLRVSSTGIPPVTRLDTSRLVQRVETNTHATDSGAVFELGGQMQTQGSRLKGNTRTRIRFEEE